MSKNMNFPFLIKKGKIKKGKSGNRALQTRGQKIYHVFNTIILIVLGLVCLLPFWHIISVSFSDKAPVIAGQVKLWPVRFTWSSYQYVLERSAFWRSLLITFARVFLGVPLNLLLVILSAYPLSKQKEKFHMRSVYVWLFFFTMLFNGGLIPTYLLVTNLKMLNTIWALVLPGCLNVFNVILMLNFFRQIPHELEDAAFVDGAGHWRILWQIFLPISLPSIATVTLFSLVGHWNSWFDGMIYMKKAEMYPLQTYLRSVIMTMNFEKMSPTELERLAKLNDRSVKDAQIIIGAIPILIVYPFLQKYFVTGMTLGSVKG